MPDQIIPFQPWKQAQPAAPAQDSDPVIAALERERDERIRSNLMMAQSPEQVAQASALAREMGVSPAQIDGLLPEAAQGQKTKALVQVAQDHPDIGAHLANNPRTAVVAQGDHQSLGLLGQTWNVVKGFGSSLQSSYYSAAAMAADTNKTFHGAVSTLTYPIDAALATVGNMTGLFNFDPDQAKAAFDAVQDRASASYQARAKAAMPKTDNWWLARAYDAAASVPVSLGAMAITLATRSPVAGA